MIVRGGGGGGEFRGVIKYLENLLGAAIFEGFHEDHKTFRVILPQICVSILCNDCEMRVGGTNVLYSRQQFYHCGTYHPSPPWL